MQTKFGNMDNFEIGTFIETHEQKLKKQTFFLNLRMNFERGTFFQTPEENEDSDLFHGGDMTNGGWIHGDEDEHMVDGKFSQYILFTFSAIV